MMAVKSILCFYSAVFFVFLVVISNPQECPMLTKYVKMSDCDLDSCITLDFCATIHNVMFLNFKYFSLLPL